MPNKADVLWFKQNFQSQIQTAIAGTKYSVDFLVAIACQETGEVWPILRTKGLSVAQVTALCVGDTLDAPNRRAFPQTKADLLSKPKGDAMFAIARDALEQMAHFIPGYQGAVHNPNKFCHGYGVFQYDIQFFLTDPDYFLQKKYEQLSESLGKALQELNAAAKRANMDNKSSLSDNDMCAIAIAYNTGHYDPAKGLKQGFFDGTHFYGENMFNFIQLSRSVQLPDPAAVAQVAANAKALGDKMAAADAAKLAAANAAKMVVGTTPAQQQTG